MSKSKFPEIKTFYEEVEDIAKSWARQNDCSYQEATQVILGFAHLINNKAFAVPTQSAEEKDV